MGVYMYINVLKTCTSIDVKRISEKREQKKVLGREGNKKNQEEG